MHPNVQRGDITLTINVAQVFFGREVVALVVSWVGATVAQKVFGGRYYVGFVQEVFTGATL